MKWKSHIMMHIYNITPFLPILGVWGTLARSGPHTHTLTREPPTIEIGQLHTNYNREGGASPIERGSWADKIDRNASHTATSWVLTVPCPVLQALKYIISFNFHSNPLRWVLLLSLLASEETRDLDRWSHLTKILNRACTTPKLWC